MINIFLLAGLIVISAALLSTFRGIRGPGIYNRLVAVNVIGTKTVIILALVGFIFERPAFLDISLVYAMFNFIITLTVARYLGRGRIG